METINTKMHVLKRNGKSEEMSFDKIKRRIQHLCYDLSIDPIKVSQKVISRIYDGVKTSELDELSAQICASLATDNLEFGILASRIIVSNNHKNTSPSFSEVITTLYNNVDVHGKKSPLIGDDVYEFIIRHKKKLNSVIDYDRDYNFDFFAFKTLERAYLMKVKNQIVERISHLLMRVSVGLHVGNLKAAIESYNFMSQKYFTHATPTLFHSGTRRPQLLSCYLLGMDDSVTGMYKTLADCAQISKWAGGIGVHISNIRSKNSRIRSTNGISNGIIPMLRVFNECAKHINQSGKRNGSIAFYLEPHHQDIMEFLQLRKNHGNEDERCRDLFLAVWISDLFMKRVEKNEEWSLMDPDECPGLNDVYGDEFEELYTRYESEGRERKRVSARQVWKLILDSQIETGTPYILFKDNINHKSNQKNIGVIKSSNLCAEIVEYSDDKEYACCTLASIALQSFVEEKKFEGKFKVYGKSGCNFCLLAKMLLTDYDYEYVLLDDDEERMKFYAENECDTMPQVFYEGELIGGYVELEDFMRPVYNFDKLGQVVKIAVRNLNNVIDINFYPVEETRLSNTRHRPLGLGVQGLADAYARMRYPFESDGAKELNKAIFETIYYYGLEESCNLAKKLGTYSTYEGSPLSEGIFQFDMWGVTPSDRYNWGKLKTKIKKNGVRNSLLTALMPTASTSQIMGSNECFEPFTSNIYSRRTIAGDFVVVNKYLIKDLTRLGLWNKDLKEKIIYYNGSVQHVDVIPDVIKELYKTVWEMKQKNVIQQSIDRGAFICQTQSLNLFFEEPSHAQLTGALFYGWKGGLKTGSYYVRTRPKVQAQQFTLDPSKFKKETKYEPCESCSG